MNRKIGWYLFVMAIVITLGMKAVQLGWFAEPKLIDQHGEPVLIFFTLSDGCDCQMKVVHAAETQLETWQTPVQLIILDFDRNPGLVENYGIVRAPALVLLEADGEVVWKQVIGISDEFPLDLGQAKQQIDTVLKNSINN